MTSGTGQPVVFSSQTLQLVWMSGWELFPMVETPVICQCWSGWLADENARFFPHFYEFHIHFALVSIGTNNNRYFNAVITSSQIPNYCNCAHLHCYKIILVNIRYSGNFLKLLQIILRKLYLLAFTQETITLKIAFSCKIWFDFRKTFELPPLSTVIPVEN